MGAENDERKRRVTGAKKPCEPYIFFSIRLESTMYRHVGRDPNCGTSGLAGTPGIPKSTAILVRFVTETGADHRIDQE